MTMKPLTVLIVDLKEPFNKIAQHYLSTFSGIDNVAITNDANRVLDMVKSLQPDIVFLNPMFLGKDTTQLCNQIKEEVETIIIIGLTIFKTLFDGYGEDLNCYDGYVSRESFGDDVSLLINGLF